MVSEGAIKRKVTIYFTDGNNKAYTNEEHTWCAGDNSISISNKYTGELMYLYPYHVITVINQESIR